MRGISFVLLFALCLGLVYAGPCPYNNCHHPEWPQIATGSCPSASAVCVCLDGWKEPGKGCTTRDIPQCSGTNCFHGSCSTTVGCECQAGWEGPLCNLATCTADCNNNGLCNNGTCECYPGFTGAACAEGSAPTYLSATFGLDWRSIIFTFSLDTNRGGKPTSRNCADFLMSLAGTGTNPVCVWENPARLVMHLPYDATIKVGHNIELKSIIKDVTGTANYTGTPSVTQTTPLTPSIVFIAPDYVGPCDNLVIDATLSKGLASRPANYTFSVVSGTNVTIPADARMGVLRIPGAMLSKSVLKPHDSTVLQFKVKVKNAFGTMSGEQTISIVRKPFDFVTVTLDQPRSLDFYIGKSDFRVTTRLGTCGLGTFTGFTYRWSITGTMGQAVTQTTSQTLRIPKASFTPGKSLHITVSVSGTGLAAAKNGTATMFLYTKWSPLNAIVGPTRSVAGVASGVMLNAWGSNAFANQKAIVPSGRVYTFTCNRAKPDGTWSTSCNDATKLPGVVVAAPTVDTTKLVYSYPANSLSPGRYRFQFSVVATGRTTAAVSGWSIIDVRPGSYEVVKELNIDGAGPFNSMLYPDVAQIKSGGVNIQFQAKCSGTAVVTGATVFATVGSTHILTLKTSGGVVPIKIRCTGSAKATDYYFDLPIGMNAMGGKLDLDPATNIQPGTQVSFKATGFYQPGFNGRITEYTFMKFPAGPAPWVKGTMPPGTITPQVVARSNLFGHVKVTAPAVSVGDYSGDDNTKVGTISGEIDTDAKEALKEKDPQKELSVADDAIAKLKNIQKANLNTAGLAHLKKGRDSVVDLVVDASANAQPDLDFGDKLVTAMMDAIGIPGFETTGYGKLLGGIKDILTTNAPIVSESNPMPKSTLDSAVVVLGNFEVVGTPSALQGQQIADSMTALNKLARASMVAGGPSLKSTTAKLAYEAIRFAVGYDLMKSMDVVQHTQSTAAQRPKIQWRSGTVTGLDALATATFASNPYGLNPRLTNNSNSYFFNLSPLKSDGTKITTPSAGLQFTVSYKVFSSQMYNYSVAKPDALTGVLKFYVNATTLDNGIVNVTLNKFSDFGLFPWYPLPPGKYPGPYLELGIIVAIAVGGVALIVILGGLGFKFGNRLKLNKHAKAAGTARPMLFYDPSAGPGEQWVQIAPDAATEREKKRKEGADEVLD